MNIGKLNRRVEIMEFFKSRDEYGGEIGEWRPIAKVWASIIPKSGTEQMLSQQITAENTVKIVIRYCRWLTVLHRIRYENRLYEIVGTIDNATLHTATIINAKELVSDGLQCKTKESEDSGGGCKQTCKRPKSNGRCSIKCDDVRSESRW